MQEVIGPYFEKHSFKILKHDMKLPVKKKKTTTNKISDLKGTTFFTIMNIISYP